MDHDEDYKSLLIRNDSSDAILTLYVYPHWCCWISKESKIIYPSDKYLYRSKKRFQFEVVARFDDRKDKKSEDDSQTDKKDEEDKQDKPKKKKQVLREVQQWKEDKLLNITGFLGSESLVVVEGDLTHYPEDKQICLRRLQRDKELKFTSGERNLYEILGLDMAKVRKMSKEVQKQVIRRGYHKQIRLWHPDNNDRGDEEIAKEIIRAYNDLEDEALRARYNNRADYDGGWLSWSRYKAIFKPECVGEEQKKAYRKRMYLFALSLLITAAGIGLTVGTAGLAAPALVAVGAVFGGGFIGGGLQSLQHTLNQRAVADECLAKEWLVKAGIGFLGGAATGGAAAGFTAAITGLGSAALESAAMTAGQYIGVGAATGATGGVAASVASDAGRKIVDGKQITWKQAVGHLVISGVIGAAAGMAGGAVTKAIVAGQVSAASANLEVEMAEQVAKTSARRLVNALTKTVPRKLTQNGAEALMGAVSRFAEERLDDSVENRSLCDHLVDCMKNLATNAVTVSVRECTAAGVSHGCNEAKVHLKLTKELQNPPSTEATNKTDEVTPHERRGQIRFKMDKENNEHLHKWTDGKCSAKYQPHYKEDSSPLSRENKKKLHLPKKNKEDRNCRRTGKWPSGYQPLINEETSSESMPSDHRFTVTMRDYGEENDGKITSRKVQQWKEDKLLKITGFIGSESLNVAEGDLAHYPEEKRICLRKLQRDKELKSTRAGRNLYEILGLDMDKVRKMTKEKQNEEIKKSYRKQIRRWHPDNNGGDIEIAKEIIRAYEILEDEALRVRYNNLVDYDSGWLSWRRYKVIIKPEIFSKEQVKAIIKTRCLLFASLLISVAGFGLTVGTAGLAAPALVATRAVFGDGLIGGGLQSFQHASNKRAIVDGCLAKEWLMKAGIGFLGRAATGGAAAGFTAAIIGLGSAALESAAMTAGQYIGVGAATGATGGVAASIASDTGRKFVDGEQITLKQVGGNAACGGLIGAVAGVAGGSVSKALVESQVSAASANLRGDAVEQVFIVTARRRFASFLAQSIPRMLTESGTEVVMGTVFRFAEERLDDSVENRRPSKHVVDGIKDVAVKGLMWAARFAAEAVSHDWNEMKVHPRLKKELQNTAYTEAMDMTSQERRGKIRCEMYMENNEHRHNWRDGKCSDKYQPPFTENTSAFAKEIKKNSDLPEKSEEDRDNHKTGKWLSGYQPAKNEETSSQSLPSDLTDSGEESASKINFEEANGKVKYISEGAWSSKMVVSYFLKGEKVVEEARGSGSSVDIPSVARKIEVKFQVRRPFWGDICKYDRFGGFWCKPYQPHVFCYDSPPIHRTFTISGGLWYEAVMRVSNEYHEETKEM